MSGKPTSDARDAVAVGDGEWLVLLEYLRDARGFDFHGYKTASLMRRVQKRMGEVGASDFAAYRDFLEVHPGEFAALFNTILINVTAFFRDPETWRVLADTIVPEILANRHPDEPMRIWSAGCASGEEAYTLAMVLAEALGVEGVRERVKIYATDIDEEALAAARQASYTDRQVEGVPPELLAKYFEREDDRWRFRTEPRRLVIFGRHDLLLDAPISRIDLLLCRNTLMYFNAEAQRRILNRFHFALRRGGILCLGRAETLMAHSASFVPVDAKRRISRRIGEASPRAPEVPTRDDPFPEAEAGTGLQIQLAALESTPVAVILMDLHNRLTFANARARKLFQLEPSDVGRPFQDLQLSYRPVELRSMQERAMADGKPVLVHDVEWRSDGEVCWLNIEASVVLAGTGDPVGTAVTFTDVTAAKRLQREVEQANQSLETAYEELQSTNEELETTNEELQSTVEELETTNEELQSTNQELETINEELNSTTEELQTRNDEIRVRSEEVNSLNVFLAAVLNGLPGGVAVVDRDIRVIGWNLEAEGLWGLRADEVKGRHLLTLDIGLPLDGIRPLLKEALTHSAPHREVVIPAVTRRGKPVDCRVSCTPLSGPGETTTGVIVLMEPVPGA